MGEADQEPKKAYPSLTEEQKLWRTRHVRVAGLDEAGRGALAGPVVAGAVILPINSKREGLWAEVQDSKLLSPARREELAARIQTQAAAWSLGEASAVEIDASGIAPATRLAMRRAVQALSPPPDHLLIDWVQLKSLNLPQQSFTKGDLRISFPSPPLQFWQKSIAIDSSANCTKTTPPMASTATKAMPCLPISPPSKGSVPAQPIGVRLHPSAAMRSYSADLSRLRIVNRACTDVSTQRDSEFSHLVRAYKPPAFPLRKRCQGPG